MGAAVMLDEREDYRDVGTIDAADVGPTIPDSWRLLDDVQLLELRDPEFLIDGVLQRKGVGVLYAPSGVGKTTLVASLTIALATGRAWFGHRVAHRGASVYVATEDPAGYKVRVRAKKIADRLSLTDPIGVYTFPEPIDLRDVVSVARFTRFLERGSPRYSSRNASGTVSRISGGSDAKSVAQVWRQLAHPSVTTVMLLMRSTLPTCRQFGH